MLQALSTPPNRARTFRILALGFALAVGAGIVGIADNPPGIVLAFGAAVAFVTAFVRPWQTAKRYVYLLSAAVLAMPAAAVLHNLMEGLAGNPGRQTLSGRLLEGAGGAFFMIAVFLCPVAIVVATAGAILLWLEKRLVASERITIRETAASARLGCRTPWRRPRQSCRNRLARFPSQFSLQQRPEGHTIRPSSARRRPR